MSKREPHLYLADIMNSIDRIASYIDDVSFEIFETDEKTIDAVVRNLEIIGEAARHVPEDFIKTNPQVPWKEMVSMRNKVLHEYFGIDIDILWETITQDLPKLKITIQKLLI
jgi:uncharacterized protein with HEPN domain